MKNKSDIKYSVAVIGSFKQHYLKVLEIVKVLQLEGLNVTSPKGSYILEEGISFVRFETDPPAYDDATIQSITLHRLLIADFVYVVAVDGYVGKTTCYEIGRLLHACRPLYFSEIPIDLPIKMPHSHILSPEELKAKLKNNEFFPRWPFSESGLGFLGELEKEIIEGEFRNF